MSKLVNYQPQVSSIEKFSTQVSNTISSGGSSAWTPVVQVTNGKGFLLKALFTFPTNTAARDHGLRITIDGVVYFNVLENSFSTGGGLNYLGVTVASLPGINGNLSFSTYGFPFTANPTSNGQSYVSASHIPIRFESSLLIEEYGAMSSIDAPLSYVYTLD